MQSLIPLLLLLEATAIPPSLIDRQRLEAELAADADVLRSLNENGNVPTIVRPVDVRFVGHSEDVRSLHEQIGALGWRVIQRVQLEDGSEALDVQRDQSTDEVAIRQLTEEALEIEARYGVRYDGWGTIVTKRE